ncbi:DUF1810 domain-containing protein [Acidisoma cellulosilytica]|uniref:DUF1810 domain-containing protein n=1 Tax=Acidisoma cellulosilyticum TaxID=2802395 RepID=A0A963Z6B1_9PROT|nr:DUF1810 domain-containing protein [Acidisoma cellulosilyticum]MCB8882623.1 DUF1810 domain-containing protein [Acidisoma cellulosilyticum]
MNADPFDLRRFVTAQAPVFETVLAELKAARKRSHWMWFVFPQLRGLGRSPTARLYGIETIDEAQAYLDHTLLGPRLILCTRTVLHSDGASLHGIFGSPDDMKFRSCMTLFEATGSEESGVFGAALDRWCAGERDAATLRLLSQ